MTEDRILITGASGCVGQYTANWFLKNTKANLLLFLRDPNKLSAVDSANPRIKLLVGDLRNLEVFSEELFTATHVIHTATAWGDIERAQQVNLFAVKKLLDLLDPNHLEKFIYFSTASILNKNLIPIPEALKYGTEYIQTKAQCLQELETHKLSNKIIAVFPTLVFGGSYTSSDFYPKSYLTQGLREAFEWLWLARWFKGFSKFHFIHAQDIALICGKLITTDAYPYQSKFKEQIPKFVLGQPSLSIDKAVQTLLRWRRIRETPKFPLWNWLIETLVTILPIRISSWDRFMIKHRDFIHEPITNPEDWGEESHAKTLKDVLFLSGLPRNK